MLERFVAALPHLTNDDFQSADETPAFVQSGLIQAGLKWERRRKKEFLTLSHFLIIQCNRFERGVGKKRERGRVHAKECAFVYLRTSLSGARAKERKRKTTQPWSSCYCSCQMFKPYNLFFSRLKIYVYKFLLKRPYKLFYYTYIRIYQK